jgi:hypothetical protein
MGVAPELWFDLCINQLKGLHNMSLEGSGLLSQTWLTEICSTKTILTKTISTET